MSKNSSTVVRVSYDPRFTDHTEYGTMTFVSWDHPELKRFLSEFLQCGVSEKIIGLKITKDRIEAYFDNK